MDPTAVDWVDVASTNVAAVGYDVPAARLWVRFASGQVYRYEGVPEAVHRAFLAAPSKGQFLYREIRNHGRDDRYECRPA